VKNWLSGQHVVLVPDSTQADTDHYGRELRYVYSDDGYFVNYELVRNGYGREYTYRMPYEFQDMFLTAQSQAEHAGLGLWGHC
jgi:micrococcal nuclease